MKMKDKQKCVVCQSNNEVKFIAIAWCHLCKKCQDDLKKGHELMNMDCENER